METIPNLCISAESSITEKDRHDYELFVSKMLKQLQDSDEYNVYLATQIISAITQPARRVAIFSEAINDPNVKHVNVIVMALGRTGDKAKEALRIIASRLESAHRVDREVAVEAIGSIGKSAKETLPLLTKIVENDDSLSVRRKALIAISQIDPQSNDVKRLLIKWIYKDSGSATACAQGIANLGPSASDAIPALIYSIEQYSNYAAVKTLGVFRKGTEEAVPILIKVLDTSKNWNMQCAAAESLGKIGPIDEEIIPALIRGLHDDIWSVRRECARSLGLVAKADTNVIPKLKRLWNDENHMVRNAAALSVWQLSGDADETLEVMNQSIQYAMRNRGDEYTILTNDHVLEDTIISLETMGPHAGEYAPKMIRFLSDPQVRIRRVALSALRKMAPSSSDAIPEVRKLLDDNDKYIRDMAKEMLIKLEEGRTRADYGGIGECRPAETE